MVKSRWKFECLVSIAPTWYSRCHCPRCLRRTHRCQTSPTWSSSETWNLRFYISHPFGYIDERTLEIYESRSASNPITWGHPSAAVQYSGRRDRSAAAGKIWTLPNQETSTSFCKSFTTSYCEDAIYHQLVIRTRSSWLNCALRDDEAVYWVSIYRTIWGGSSWLLMKPSQ